MATAVIYARFSCSKQREASIEDQLRVCEEWCAREGYHVVATYSDFAISGRTDNRPEFQRMVENAGESDIVLVYMMDRFSRDPYDAPIYKKKLMDRGVRVVSATESLPDGPEYVLVDKIYEGIAAIESAHISQRTKRGMHGNALKCMHNGVRVFGYRFGEDGHYEIDEDEADVVREVYRRRAGGESACSIARDLKARGYRTYANNPVGASFVTNMLKCEKYRGVYIFGDVRVEGGMPRILNDDEWQRGHSARGYKRRNEEEWADFFLKELRGGIVCQCGGTCVGVSGNGRDGRRYDYYRCNTQTRREATPCGTKPVRRDWVEGRLAEALRAMLEDREVALSAAHAIERYLETNNREATAKAERLRRREKEAEKQLNNLMTAVEQGMPYELARDRMEALVRERAVAAAEAETVESKVVFDAEDFADFLQMGATLDDKALIQAFVWQVIVEDEWVTAILNYDLAPETPARVGVSRSHDGKSGLDITGAKRIRTTLPADRAVRTDEVWLPFVADARNNEPTSLSLVESRVAVRFSRAA